MRLGGGGKRVSLSSPAIFRDRCVCDDVAFYLSSSSSSRGGGGTRRIAFRLAGACLPPPVALHRHPKYRLAKINRPSPPPPTTIPSVCETRVHLRTPSRVVFDRAGVESLGRHRNFGAEIIFHRSSRPQGALRPHNVSLFLETRLNRTRMTFELIVPWNQYELVKIPRTSGVDTGVEAEGGVGRDDKNFRRSDKSIYQVSKSFISIIYRNSVYR